MKTEIVGSSKREIIDIGEWIYVYIPMSKKEQKEFAPRNINACWRIKAEEK